MQLCTCGSAVNGSVDTEDSLFRRVFLCVLWAFPTQAEAAVAETDGIGIGETGATSV